jgi:ATP-dependent DNA helicase PIF1
LIYFTPLSNNFSNLFSFSINSLNGRVIIAPKNEQSDLINSIATDMFPGEPKIIRSYDKIIADAQQAQFPTEFLNSLNITGLPTHILNLKIGLPIILIRNINPAAGLCNGTRLIIKNIYTRLIEAEIAIGERKGTVVFIPKMQLIPTETDLPFEFTRFQFPIRPCFSMSINKAQGQTLDYVSIWLGDEHVFTHGQLYVALSRVSDISNIKIATDNPLLMTRNVVYKEALNLSN